MRKLRLSLCQPAIGLAEHRVLDSKLITINVDYLAKTYYNCKKQHFIKILHLIFISQTQLYFSLHWCLFYPMCDLIIRKLENLPCFCVIQDTKNKYNSAKVEIIRTKQKVYFPENELTIWPQMNILFQDDRFYLVRTCSFMSLTSFMSSRNLIQLKLV